MKSVGQVNGSGVRDPHLGALGESVERFNHISRWARPLISVVTPTWNTRPEWFSQLAMSLLEQNFVDWEWCIVDDCSSSTEFHECFANLHLSNIKIHKLNKPEGISGATNRGVEMARGEFVCFVDHDDLLPSNALEASAGAIGRGCDALYTDSDKIDELGHRSEPFHKPDWSPEYFRGVMYVGHLLCVRRALALDAGGFDSRFDGVQDFEFFLRFSEMTDNIRHVPEILYHWRTVPGSVAARADAKGDLGKLQQTAAQAQLNRLRLCADAEPGEYPHRVRIVPRPRVSWPKVSVIIPTKDSPDILQKCLYSLFAKTTYSNFDVVCIDNETSDRRAIEEMRKAPVQRVIFSGQFNFSRANNLALEFSTGEYLVFMNNDIEVISPDWIEQMLYYAEQKDVGAVGGLLIYPDGTVQHAGVVLGCRGTADHVLRGAPGHADGYAGSLSCAREVTAVTGACLMIRREVFVAQGGFNEHFFTAYQDVDLCLRLREQKKRIVFTPQARFIHRESVSRGKYYDFVDRNLLLDYWEPLIKSGDPYYNPNLRLEPCDYSLTK